MWLLIDYLKNSDIGYRQRIMDIGCGWGLPGIYCAKNLNADVTSIDGDDEVYPYLKAQAEANCAECHLFPSTIDFEVLAQPFKKVYSRGHSFLCQIYLTY
jgi:cyclopropane fatty-acyl-phospholipid synthase-like methyltransferase